MNNLILCEGRVDVALIGQYLAANNNWHYIKKYAKSKYDLHEEDHCQDIEKYKRNEDWLYIGVSEVGLDLENRFRKFGR
jgi:hypothetical protein